VFRCGCLVYGLSAQGPRLWAMGRGAEDAQKSRALWRVALGFRAGHFFAATWPSRASTKLTWCVVPVAFLSYHAHSQSGTTSAESGEGRWSYPVKLPDRGGPVIYARRVNPRMTCKQPFRGEEVSAIALEWLPGATACCQTVAIVTDASISSSSSQRRSQG
jgi:hypothetical protein